MKTILFTIFAFALTSFIFLEKEKQLSPFEKNGELPDPCLVDSLPIITNNTTWKIANNSLGHPNNVNASVITYQYNTIPNFANAKWISSNTSWTYYTYTSEPDDSVAFEFPFKTCLADNIHFSFTVKRDNYCTVYIDNNKIWQDPVIWDYDYYNYGDLIDITLPITVGTHKIKIVTYNRNSFSGTNGFGMMAGGYMKGTKNSIVNLTSNCANYSCTPLSVTNNALDNSYITVYPNPSNDKIIFVDAPNLSTHIEYGIYSMNGQVIAHGKLNKKTNNIIELQHVSFGNYILRLKDNPKSYKFLMK